MKLILKWHEPDWWFWPVTLGLILIGLFGWQEGFLWAVIVNALQVGYFVIRERSLTAFSVQVRLVFFALVALAMLDPTRILFAMLGVGSAMVAFFDRCLIARVLVLAPWNRDVELH